MYSSLTATKMVHHFTLPHALSCPHGAFPIIRHNEVRDLTASLMTEVCHDVQVEPHLHALSGEVMHHRSAVLDDNARVDIRASVFGGAYIIAPFLLFAFLILLQPPIGLPPWLPLFVGMRGGDYSTERNGTERNDGLNCGTECFLRLKLAAYHCCTSYQWHFQQVIKRTPRKIKRI